MMLNPLRRNFWPLTFVLVACLLVSLMCVAYPMYVIRPFRAQGARELSIALDVLRLRPFITVICAGVAVTALVWRRRAWPLAALVCVLALLARVNVYELMFHPAGRPLFAAVQRVKLDKDEKVIAIKMGSQARAYPIRSISYHHVINDVVDNRAIVATY